MDPSDAPSYIMEWLEPYDENIGESFEQYRRDTLTPTNQVSLRFLDKRRGDPLFDRFCTFQTVMAHGSRYSRIVEIPYQAHQVLAIASYFLRLEKASVATESGVKCEQNAAQHYAAEIASRRNAALDVVYEMQILDTVLRVGAHGAAIRPSTSGKAESAPDHVVYEACNTYYLECKRRSEAVFRELELARLGQEIADKAFSRANFKEALGDDSFAVRVSASSDPPKRVFSDRERYNELVKALAESCEELVRNRGTFATTEVQGISYGVELDTYIEGPIRRQVEKEALRYAIASGDSSPIIDYSELFPSAEDRLATHGHGAIHFRTRSDCEVDVVSSVAFILDIPWDIPYHEVIYDTVRGIPKQHKWPNRLIGFVDIPSGIIWAMMRETVEDHRGRIVTKWDRLKSKIQGIYAQKGKEGRLRAVVMTSEHLAISEQGQWSTAEIRPMITVLENTEQGESSAKFVERMEQELVGLEEAVARGRG